MRETGGIEEGEEGLSDLIPAVVESVSLAKTDGVFSVDGFDDISTAKRFQADEGTRVRSENERKEFWA